MRLTHAASKARLIDAQQELPSEGAEARARDDWPQQRTSPPLVPGATPAAPSQTLEMQLNSKAQGALAACLRPAHQPSNKATTVIQTTMRAFELLELSYTAHRECATTWSPKYAGIRDT